MRIAASAAVVFAAWCGPATAQDEKPKTLSGDEIKQLAALIKQLDSKQFAERDKATKELADFGIRGLETLEKAARDPVTLETQRRLGMVIWKLKAPAREEEAKRIAKQVAELVPKLSSPKFRDRQQATEALIAIGRPALEHLYAVTLTPDLEAVRRADTVISTILKKAE